jgi:uncharacterized RDD family membrane protein YckC
MGRPLPVIINSFSLANQEIGRRFHGQGYLMREERAVAVRRLFAFAVDWFVVVVLWGGMICGAVMLATGGKPPRPGSPWAGQAIGFLSITMPFTLYLALFESSPMRASLGKRALGLVVSQETGGRLSFGSALLRKAVKFAPWEFGHIVTWQSFFSGEEGLPAWVWGPATIAFVGPVWWLVTIIATGRTPYDRWASARVRISRFHESRSETTAEPFDEAVTGRDSASL